MEKIQPGKYVELGYDLYRILPDGTEELVHQTDKEDPERIIFGVTQGMIRPLEEAVDGLEPGGTFDVTVKAADAFGMPDPEQVVTGTDLPENRNPGGDFKQCRTAFSRI